MNMNITYIISIYILVVEYTPRYNITALKDTLNHQISLGGGKNLVKSSLRI